MSNHHQQHQETYPAPQRGTSLLLNFHGNESHHDHLDQLHLQFPRRNTILLIGNYSNLMYNQAILCLESGYQVILAKFNPQFIEPNQNVEILNRIKLGQLACCDDLPSVLDSKSIQTWLKSIPNFHQINLISLIELQTNQQDHEAIQDLMISLKTVAYHLRIPLNLQNNPLLSDFTFPVTYRWPLTHQPTNQPTQKTFKSSLQIALSSSGSSTILENRLKREIISKLNERVGDACEAIAELKSRTQLLANHDFQLQAPQSIIPSPQIPLAQHLILKTDPTSQGVLDNGKQRFESSWISETTLTQISWISQISQYWPITQIANLHQNPQAINEILNPPSTHKLQPNLSLLPSSDHQGVYTLSVKKPNPNRSSLLSPQTQPSPTPKKGSIYLVGSGPGHASLLTCAAYTLLTKSASVILCDKLVPDQIINLIPNHIKLFVSKKFPGNSEFAQCEFMEQAIKFAELGETVVRLKQGDPFIYGRGGEEILFFRKAGYEATVIPGISSSIAAPLLFNIPLTQRGVSESVVLCTGVGRRGKQMSFPSYQRSRTLVILMGVIRLESIVKQLLEMDLYPGYLPIGIIERASSFDQRILLSTLSNVVESFQSIGDQRPPGMIVIGWSVMCLDGNGSVDILDHPTEELQEVLDRKRITDWLCGKTFFVKHGMNKAFDELHQRFTNST